MLFLCKISLKSSLFLPLRYSDVIVSVFYSNRLFFDNILIRYSTFSHMTNSHCSRICKGNHFCISFLQFKFDQMEFVWKYRTRRPTLPIHMSLMRLIENHFDFELADQLELSHEDFPMFVRTSSIQSMNVPSQTADSFQYLSNSQLHFYSLQTFSIEKFYWANKHLWRRKEIIRRKNSNWKDVSKKENWIVCRVSWFSWGWITCQIWNVIRVSRWIFKNSVDFFDHVNKAFSSKFLQFTFVW